jgi:anti-anti-sigma factor
VLRPISAEYPDDETFAGLLILRPEGRIFFVNAQYIADQVGHLTQQYQAKVLVLDLSRVQDIEYSALKILMDREKSATESGGVFWLAGLNPGVLEVVRRVGFADRLGRERMLFNANAAIDRYQQLYANPQNCSKSLLNTL